MAFRKPVDGTKFRLTHKNLMKSVHDYYNHLPTVFKENSGLRLDGESVEVTFNSMLINDYSNFPFS